MTYARKAEKVVLSDHKLIYVNIPKTGCTTVKQLISDVYDWTVVENVHNPKSEIYRHIVHEDISTQNYADFTKFTIIRNPLSRLLSAYKSKVRPNATHPVFIDGVEKGIYKLGIRKHHTFSDFVEIIAKTNDDIADPHVLSQHQFIFDDNGQCLVTKILRFEQFDDAMTEVLRMLAIPTTKPIPHLNRTTTSPGSFIKEYDESLKTLVAQRYAKDLELFGYTIPW